MSDRPAQLNRAYQNQFEMPVLFYVLVAFVLITQRANTLFVVMEWVFVACRFLHAYVHVTSNRVQLRFSLFLAGFAILMAMWLILAGQVLFGF